jgi:uncharacterized protein
MKQSLHSTEMETNKMSAYKPKTAVIWVEIPVSDLTKSKAFYGAVLQNELTDQEMGPFPTAVFSYAEGGVGGHLYVGKPGAAGSGNVVHLSVAAPLEDALGRVKSAGGQVVSDIIAIPDGRFAYCLDIDGNSFGLFV